MVKPSYEKVQVSQDTNAFITYACEKSMRASGLFVDRNYIPAHWHRSIEFSLVYKGKIELWINNHKETIKEGEFIFVNSGQVHKVGSGSDFDIEVLIVIISYEFLKKALPNIDELLFDITKIYIEKERLYEIYDFFRNYDSTSKENDELMINAYLYELIYKLMKYCVVDQEGNKKGYMIAKQRQHEILDYIEENYKEDLCLATLAEHCHMSEEHFSRTFRESFGMNFKAYLTNYRLYCSYDDVVESVKSIQNIALDYGFSNVKSFINAFKKGYGRTPYQYRKQMEISKNDNLSVKYQQQ